MRVFVPVVACVLVWMLLGSAMFTELGSFTGFLVAWLLVIGGLPFVVLGGIVNLPVEFVVSLAAIAVATFYLNRTWSRFIHGDMIAVRSNAIAMVNLTGIVICATISLQQVGSA